jgi:hypothetical protein
MLKAIGFWTQSLKDEKQPSPQELVGVLPGDVRPRLVEYLASGHAVRHSCGCSWCRFGCGIDNSRMGWRDLSDGTWLWPEGLSHYVREHGIVLPEEFIVHALSTPIRPLTEVEMKLERYLDGFFGVGEPVIEQEMKELEEFVEHAPSSDIAPEYTGEVDTEFWVRWSASRRRPEFLERLRAARAAAELEAQLSHSAIRHFFRTLPSLALLPPVTR